MRTLTRAAALAAAALLAPLLPAAPAAAAIDPAEAAWIRADGVAVDYGPPDLHLWLRKVTVRSTGALPGRSGNRHTAELQLSKGPSPRPDTWPLTLRDEQCAADGAVRVAMPVPASTLTTTVPEGAPVPIGDTSVDVTLTPVGWRDVRDPDVPNAPRAWRNAGPVSDLAGVADSASGDEVSASGTIGGVPAAVVVSSSWSDTAFVTGVAGPPIPPLVTRAQQAEYAPVLRRGRTTTPVNVGFTWHGRVVGTLVTSTGVRLEGNVRDVYLPFDSLVPAGRPLAGSVPIDLSAQGYTCADPAGDLTACTPTEGPLLTPGQARFAADRFGAIAVDATVHVSLPDGTDLGTLTIRAALAPTGPGEGARSGEYDRFAGTWSTNRQLARWVRGPFRMGGLVGTANTGTQFPDDAPQVRLTSQAAGTL